MHFRKFLYLSGLIDIKRILYDLTAIPEEAEDCFRELIEVLKPAAELVRRSGMTLRQALCEM